MPKSTPEQTTDMIPVMAAVMEFLEERELQSHVKVQAGSYKTPVTHFRISTWDRHLWLDIREDIAKLVQPMGTWVDEQRSWSGAREHLYVFGVFPDPEGKRSRHPMVICRSEDLRADRNMFKYLDERGVEPLDASYMWTETGVEFSIHGKGQAKAVQRVFSDCETELSPVEGERGNWNLTIIFPE